MGYLLRGWESYGRLLTFLLAILAVSAFALSAPGPHLSAGPETQETPIGDLWWPSEWGLDDEAGASNRITPAKVLEATQLIQTGQIYELGRHYEHGMPLFGQRTYSLVIPGAPTGGPFPGSLIYHDEFIAGELGQVGTQFDGLGHVGVQLYDRPGYQNEIRLYNGFTETETVSAYGLNKLGVEKVKPIFTTGVLIDVAGYRGRMLEAGEEITLADVRGALRRQGMTESDVGSGDAVLFNTGWGSLWMTDNERYNGATPGIGMEVARWLSAKKVTLVGADSFAVEVTGVNPDAAFRVHLHLIVRHGIFLHENLNLAELAADQVYQFAYVFVRVPFKGATGSPGSPIAIR